MYFRLSKKFSEPNSLFPALKVQKPRWRVLDCVCLCFSSAWTLGWKLTFFISFPGPASFLLSKSKMGSSSELSSCVYVSRPFDIKDLRVPEAQSDPFCWCRKLPGKETGHRGCLCQSWRWMGGNRTGDLAGMHHKNTNFQSVNIKEYFFFSLTFFSVSWK